MTPILPFSVNQYLCPPSMRPTAFMDQVKLFGFNGTGITQAALSSLEAHTMAEEHAQKNLSITSLNSAGFFLLKGEAARAQEEQNSRLLEQAAALGNVKLNVIVGGTDLIPLSEARSLAASRLESFADQARSQGVELMIEPLHHLNVRTKSCFNTISQLSPLFDRVPGLTVNVDLFHLWWDPDLDDLVNGKSLPVGLLQICDVALLNGITAPRRVPLGEGCIAWADHIKSVKRSFPGVPVELELFADQMPERRLNEILTTSATALFKYEEGKR